MEPVRLIIIAAALAAAPALATDLSLSGGGWSETIDASDLVSGAGSHIRSPIASGGGVFQLAISNTGGVSWTLRLRRDTGAWPGDVSIAARRTSDGSGPGSISGGVSYLTLTTVSQVLFTGSGDRIGIGIQLKAEGYDVGDAPDTYSTTLTYSID